MLDVVGYTVSDGYINTIVCGLHKYGRSFSKIGFSWCHSGHSEVQLCVKGMQYKVIKLSEILKWMSILIKVLELLIKERLQTLSGSARKILLELVEATVLHCELLLAFLCSHSFQFGFQA